MNHFLLELNGNLFMSILNTKWQVASTDVYLILIFNIASRLSFWSMRTPTCSNYTKTFHMLVYFFRGLINQLIIILAPTKFLCSVFLNFIKSFDLNHRDWLLLLNDYVQLVYVITSYYILSSYSQSSNAWLKSISNLRIKFGINYYRSEDANHQNKNWKNVRKYCQIGTIFRKSRETLSKI